MKLSRICLSPWKRRPPRSAREGGIINIWTGQTESPRLHAPHLFTRFSVPPAIAPCGLRAFLAPCVLPECLAVSLLSRLAPPLPSPPLCWEAGKIVLFIVRRQGKLSRECELYITMLLSANAAKSRSRKMDNFEAQHSLRRFTRGGGGRNM